MRHVLDNIEAIKRLDCANVLGSIEELGNQCQQAWDEVQKLQFPQEYRHVRNIVFSGMGGSALGAYVVKSLFFNELPMPFEIVNDYNLPPYVDKHTLVILSTYSGTTEETLSCAKEALEKKAQITGLTTGGKLSHFFTSNKLPGYIFSPNYNPSNQPRMGTGYSIFGLITILNKLGILNVSYDSLEQTIKTLTNGNNKYGVLTETSKNTAKKIATNWVGKIPIIVAADFLTNVGRVIRNQLHESAKSFAAFHDIPELNHHLMEGLKHPQTNKEMLTFLFITSSFYPARIAKRIEITKEVVVKNGIKASEFQPTSSNRIAQVFECIQFGAYINYYLAILYGVDPSKIPWVDYFKSQLSS